MATRSSDTRSDTRGDHVRAGDPDGGAVRAGAVVVGGDYRALGIVRSLGRRGIPVWVVTDHHRLAGVSRYCKRRLALPDDDPDRIVDLLVDLGGRERLEGWALFPSTDECASVIARHASALQGFYRLTTPPWDVMRLALDKRAMHRLAEEAGVGVPWTRWGVDRHDLTAFEDRYPLILKPAVREGENGFTFAKAWRIGSQEELRTRFEEASSLVDAPSVMVQELIPSTREAQLSYGAVCEEGRPLASVVARRWRQHPIDFGRSSSYVESVEDPEVETQALRLLERLRFSGLVEVEFMRDTRDGRLKLLDVNPRVWGWHTLGERAGVDFCYEAWRLAMGEQVARQHVPPGVSWVRLVTDVPAVGQYLRQGLISPLDYLRSLRPPIQFGVLAADDPGPGLLEVPLLGGLWLKRRLGRRRPKSSSRTASSTTSAG